MSLSAVLTTVEKDVELAAGDVLKWLGKGRSEIAKAVAAEPQVLAALGVVAAGVGTALGDVETGAANPATLVLNIPKDIQDLKAVWPAVVAFLATLGIVVK